MAGLPKINTNRILQKAVQIGDRLAGHSARRYESAANTLSAANSMGLRGANKVSDESIRRMSRLAQVQRGRSTQTRIKAGVGTAVAGASGLFGVHKYYQHKDEKIMERINARFAKNDTGLD